MTKPPFIKIIQVIDELALAKKKVKERALEASKAIEKVDPDLHQFWNLVISERRLYIASANKIPDRN